MYKINEAELNDYDVKELFKKAAELRSKPTGIGKFIKGLRKPTIDVNDLQQAWKDESFPNDTKDITNILLGHGFSKKEIQKVFTGVYGEPTKGEHDMPAASPAIQNIADFIKKHGLQKEVLAVLEKEYNIQESQQFPEKTMVEDIRKIFTAIVQEERSQRAELIQEYEQSQLGRIKK